MKLEIKRIDHIQICIPKGEENKGREFYCEILGLKEIEKPEPLKKDGGFWVEAGNIQIHIGTEDVQPISKRHPAFEIQELTKMKKYLANQGINIAEHEKIPGVSRFSIFDFWNNRIELLERKN